MPRQLTSAMASPEGSVDSFQLDEWKTECVSGDAPERDNTESPFLLPSEGFDQPCTFVSRPHNVAGAVRSQGFSRHPVRRLDNHVWQPGYLCRSRSHSLFTS